MEYLHCFKVGDMVQFADLQIMFIIGFEDGQFLLERVDGDGIYYAHPLYPAKKV